MRYSLVADCVSFRTCLEGNRSADFTTMKLMYPNITEGGLA